MTDEEIQKQIAAFPQWHYQFDLGGHLTPIREQEWVNRHNQRKQYFFDPLVQLHGNSLAGKRVLDLGCNAGFWSLHAARAGCDYVLGIDGRQMHVDQANFVFEVNGVDASRYDFLAADLFETDLIRFGKFDIVLCLGLMYHVSRHVELIEKIAGVNKDMLLIDTSLATEPGSLLKLRHDHAEDPRSAVDRTLVMAPTWEAMRDLATEFEYSVAVLKPRFDSYEGAKDYRNRRRAFLCAKQTDAARIEQFTEIEAKPPSPPSKSKPQGEPPTHQREQRLIEQADSLLADLFTSRRWKFAKALSTASRLIFRQQTVPTAEDKLLDVMNKLRNRKSS